MIFKITGVPCPAGRYGNTTGLAAPEDCTLCDAGHYCSQPGLIHPDGLCAAGHYCVLGATGSSPINETWGYLCPEGRYCPQGTPSPVKCDRGTYQPELGEYFLLLIY